MDTSLAPNGCGRSSGVEHYLANVRVVSSNLIARSNFSWSTCCLPRIGPSLCARLDFARKSRAFCERVRGSSCHVPRPHPNEEQVRRANTSRTEGRPLRIKYFGWLRMSRRGIAAVRARLWRRSTLIGFAALCNTPCKSGVWKRSSCFRSREPLSRRHVTQLREDREIFHGELRRRLSRIPVRQAASSRPSLRAGMQAPAGLRLRFPVRIGEGQIFRLPPLLDSGFGAATPLGVGVFVGHGVVCHRREGELRPGLVDSGHHPQQHVFSNGCERVDLCGKDVGKTRYPESECLGLAVILRHGADRLPC